MSEKDILVEYMQKLKNMADFLARGYTLQSPYEENIIIEIVDDEMTTQRDAFSIQEHNTYDVLELSFKGEQKSIRTLMEYIEDGEYERQIEGKIDFNEPYIPEQYKAEFYQRVMKRVNVILKSMAVYLSLGNRIPLDDCELFDLKVLYLDEDELSAEVEEEQEGYLIYSAQNQYFYVTDLEGNILIEDIDIHEAMGIYNDFLTEQEQQRLCRKAGREKENNDNEER